jgi:hypothetical protein
MSPTENTRLSSKKHNKSELSVASFASEISLA